MHGECYTGLEDARKLVYKYDSINIRKLKDSRSASMVLLVDAFSNIGDSE